MPGPTTARLPLRCGARRLFIHGIAITLGADLTRPLQNGVFQSGDDIPRDRRIAPLPRRRAYLAVGAASGDDQRNACSDPDQQAVITSGHVMTFGATMPPAAAQGQPCARKGLEMEEAPYSQILGGNLAAVRGRISAAARAAARP